tara:strand:+ start:4207 stop:5319 length:1113 start_codon:yes stop_codon:yes gene_type:complete
MKEKILTNVNYEKAIMIFDDLELCARILSPFVFIKTIQVDERMLEVEEKFNIPILHDSHQISKYEKIATDKIRITISSGLLKNTTILVKFSVESNNTYINTEINVKTKLVLSPVKKIIEIKISRVLQTALKNFECYSSLIYQEWNNCLTIDGGLRIQKHNELLTMFGWYLSTIPEIFCTESYSFLPVNNKIVVDVGANIGDSTIYFALKGAKKIIGVEPFPKNFEYATKNILTNKLENRIILENIIISDENRSISVDKNYKGTGAGNIKLKKGNSIRNITDGTRIQTSTIGELLKKYSIDECLLKLDCEGCEYDVILKSDKQILKKFTHIILEYHDGYSELKEKIIECGFDVKIINEKENVGILYATRIN